MRAALVVVMLALLSACRPDEPDDVAVVSEPPAPQQADVLQPATYWHAPSPGPGRGKVPAGPLARSPA